MKKTTSTAVVINAGIAALFASTAAMATAPSAGGSGTVSAGTAVAGSFSVGSNGSSYSYAQNAESAKASISAAKNAAPYYTNVNAAVKGSTQTDSFGKAYNVSTGSGSGNALSTGYADTAVKGKVGIDGVTTGFNGGGSGTQTDNMIKAGTNQGSYVAGQTTSGFDVEVNYSKGYGTAPVGSLGNGRSANVTVSGSSTGYASGVNESGALKDMNAAGIANIGASGYFFGKTNLSGSTGYVSAR